MIRLFWLPFFLLPLKHFGQTRSEMENMAPRSVIKISPLHLLNFYPTLQVAYEQGLSRRVSIQLDGGYVLNYSNALNESYQNKRGTKLKAEARYYITKSRNGVWHQYSAGEFYYNAINFDRRLTTIECFDQDCIQLFQRTYFYKVRYRETGGSLKYGLAININRIFIDINAGLSLRIIEYDKPPQDSAGFGVSDGHWFSPDETNRTVAGPAAGIRFGYMIR